MSETEFGVASLGSQSCITCDRGSAPSGAGYPPTDGAKEKSRCPADIPLDFAAKASIAVGVDGLLFGRPAAWPQAPGLWWCKHRDRRGAEMENEAMATRQASKPVNSLLAAHRGGGGMSKG